MKSQAKIIFALLSMLCMLGAGETAAAQVSLSFDPASPTVASGGAISARLLANIPNPIIGYGLDLQFDSVALSFDSLEVGPSWFSATSANGSPLVGLAFPGPVSGPDVVLATLHFHVNQGQCRGTTTLSVNAKPDDLTEGFALVTGGFADFSPASADVSLVDVTPPVIANAAADQPVLWPPNHKMVTVILNYVVSDNCDAASAVVCSVSVSSNESTSAPGSGNTTPDWNVIDAHHVQLRAERSGAGTGRVYNNAITCTDTSGNSSTQNVPVTVPHDQGNP
jgi:hypothetical protein